MIYAFGRRIREPVQDITPTFLSPRVLELLRECDDVANLVLQRSGTNAIDDVAKYDMDLFC